MVSLPHPHASASTIPPGESGRTSAPGGGLRKHLNPKRPLTVPVDLVLDPWISDRMLSCWARCSLFLEGRTGDDPTTNPDWVEAVVELVETGWLTIAADGGFDLQHEPWGGTR